MAFHTLPRQRGRSRYSNIDLLKKYNYIGLRHFLSGRGYIDMKYLFYTYPEQDYPLDFDTYFKSKDRFVMVTSNCLTGKAEYFEEKKDKNRLVRYLLRFLFVACIMPGGVCGRYSDGGWWCL